VPNLHFWGWIEFPEGHCLDRRINAVNAANFQSRICAESKYVLRFEYFTALSGLLYHQAKEIKPAMELAPFMKNLGFFRMFAVALLSGVFLNASAQASILYLANGDGAQLHRIDLDTGTYLGASTTYSLAYPIAVVDTVRLGHRDNSAGAEYDLDGNATGVTWAAGSPISQLLDGTTDGSTYNYAVGCCGSNAVYRFDRFWGNAELLFSIATGGSGITYDSVNNTLWVQNFTGSIEQYDLVGNLISTIAASGDLGTRALAYDSTSDSFWSFVGGDTLTNFDRSGTLLRTLVVEGLNGGNAFGGEIMMGSSAVPEPSTFALAFFGVAGLVIYRRRKA